MNEELNNESDGIKSKFFMVQHLTKELKNAHEEMSRRNCEKPKIKPAHEVKH